MYIISLVVADGAYSSVRRYMYPEMQLNFPKHVCLSGVTTVEAGESLPNQVQSSPVVGSTGKGLGCFMAAIDEKSFFWVVVYSSDEPKSPPFKGSAMTKNEQEDFINEVLTRSDRFLSDEFCTAVRKCDRQRILIFNNQDKLPHKNPSEKHIIFIGDSLHPMSPAAGNGANMAIMDGVELVQLLIKHHAEENGDLVARSIDEFDRDHVQRSILAVRTSRRNMASGVATGLKFQVNKKILKIVAFSVNNPLLFKSLLIAFASVFIMLLILYLRNLF
jgi:2-polyprenyl-6-methoxyphenol hydroxylase-like FAD-dependent oxidoreductase